MIWKFIKNLFKKRKKPKQSLYVNYKGNEIKVTLDDKGLPYLIEPPMNTSLASDDIIEIIKLVGRVLEARYFRGEE